MSIKELREKFRDSPPDRILVRELEIFAKIKRFEEHGGIILEDNTGTLEAITVNNDIYKILRENIKEGNKLLKLKGRLSKTDYEDLSFCIQEIIQ